MRPLQEGVARADLVVASMLRWAAAVILLAAVLLAALLTVRHLTRAEPPRIDRCDVTSEGPEGERTPAFDEWEDEDT